MMYGLPIVFHAVVVSLIEYVAHAWSGMCSAADRTRLDSLLRCSERLGYCRIDQLEVADMFSAAEDDFFSHIKSKSYYVLQQYLHDDNEIPYQLHARSHTLALINKTRERTVHKKCGPLVQCFSADRDHRSPDSVKDLGCVHTDTSRSPVSRARDYTGYSKQQFACILIAADHIIRVYNTVEERLTEFMEDIAQWTASNRLKLNPV